MTAKELRKKFLETGKSLSPQFLIDDSLRTRGAVSIKRNIMQGQWQFLALFVHQMQSEIFLEVALSPYDHFPIDYNLQTPNQIQDNDIIRFRASELWGHINHHGWLINDKKPEPEFGIALLLNQVKELGIEVKSEGFYDTVDDAMDNIKWRITNWILPYFNFKVEEFKNGS